MPVIHMSLIITLVPNTTAGVDDFSKLLQAELLAVDPPLTSADAVSRYLSAKGNPRVRPNTTGDRSVNVEMRTLSGEWTTILTVSVA